MPFETLGAPFPGGPLRPGPPTSGIISPALGASGILSRHVLNKRMPSLFTGTLGDSRCPICNASYKNRNTLLKHMKKHQGQTMCPVCQHEFSEVSNLRRHMVTLHGMLKQEVDRITKKRLSAMEIAALWNQGQAP